LNPRNNDPDEILRKYTKNEDTAPNRKRRGKENYRPGRTNKKLKKGTTVLDSLEEREYGPRETMQLLLLTEQKKEHKEKVVRALVEPFGRDALVRVPIARSNILRRFKNYKRFLELGTPEEDIVVKLWNMPGRDGALELRNHMHQVYEAIAAKSSDIAKAYDEEEFNQEFMKVAKEVHVSRGKAEYSFVQPHKKTVSQILSHEHQRLAREEIRDTRIIGQVQKKKDRETLFMQQVELATSAATKLKPSSRGAPLTLEDFKQLVASKKVSCPEMKAYIFVRKYHNRDKTKGIAGKKEELIVQTFKYFVDKKRITLKALTVAQLEAAEHIWIQEAKEDSISPPSNVIIWSAGRVPTAQRQGADSRNAGEILMQEGWKEDFDETFAGSRNRVLDPQLANDLQRALGCRLPAVAKRAGPDNENHWVFDFISDNIPVLAAMITRAGHCKQRVGNFDASESLLRRVELPLTTCSSDFVEYDSKDHYHPKGLICSWTLNEASSAREKRTRLALERRNMKMAQRRLTRSSTSTGCIPRQTWCSDAEGTVQLGGSTRSSSCSCLDLATQKEYCRCGHVYMECRYRPEGRDWKIECCVGA